MSILTCWRVVALALHHIAHSWIDNQRSVKRLECGYLLRHQDSNVAWAGLEGAQAYMCGERAESLIQRGKAFSC
jgi:hypothetical protein